MTCSWGGPGQPAGRAVTWAVVSPSHAHVVGRILIGAAVAVSTPEWARAVGEGHTASGVAGVHQCVAVVVDGGAVADRVGIAVVIHVVSARRVLGIRAVDGAAVVHP